jgi:hypothetical protein
MGGRRLCWARQALNADVGDVMIPTSYTTSARATLTGWTTVSPPPMYSRTWSTAPALDNQRAVAVRGTFLQNRDYLDILPRRYTIVEMEAASSTRATIAPPGRYPVGESVNMARLSFDWGSSYASGRLRRLHARGTRAQLPGWIRRTHPRSRWLGGSFSAGVLQS